MEKTDNSYIAIDLETTGLNPKTERIIEIGAARVEDGTVVQTYSTFVNPERELDARIRELTGICDDDLKDAPVLDTVLPELLAFCGELPLLGHHVIFDFSFLKRAAVNRKYTFEHAGLDTLKICRHFINYILCRMNILIHQYVIRYATVLNNLTTYHSISFIF